MCVVSMVGDHFSDKWQQPNYQDYFKNLQNITRLEFDQLKKEVEEMKELLKRAIEYDKRNNEPNCEIEDKVKLLKDVAKMFGVDLSEVFKQDESGK